MVNRDLVRTPRNNTGEGLRELVTELNVMATKKRANHLREKVQGSFDFKEPDEAFIDPWGTRIEDPCVIMQAATVLFTKQYPSLWTWTETIIFWEIYITCFISYMLHCCSAFSLIQLSSSCHPLVSSCLCDKQQVDQSEVKLNSLSHFQFPMIWWKAIVGNAFIQLPKSAGNV